MTAIADRAITAAGPQTASLAARAVVPLLIAALVAGQLQNILELRFPAASVVTLIDDALLAAAFLATLPRLLRSPGASVLLLGLWLVALAISAVYSISVLSFRQDEMIFMYRQVAMPALIMLIGITLERHEWRSIGTAVIVIGLVNVAYVGVELTLGRPFDPVASAAAEGRYVGYYNGSDILTGASFQRAGGLVLNPPTAGIFLAAAAILAARRAALFARWPIVVVLLASLWATGSRGGLLVAIIGLLLPWAAHRFNAWVAIVIMAIASLPFAIEISTHKGSFRHAAGLIRGLQDAFAHPFGRGFGFVGNHRPDQVESDAGESLLGIAFSAGGLLAIVLIGILVVVYLSRLNGGGPRAWVSALALGGLLAALFSETAGSVDGTVAMWLAAGLALSRTLSTGAADGAISLKATRRVLAPRSLR